MEESCVLYILGPERDELVLGLGVPVPLQVEEVPVVGVVALLLLLLRPKLHTPLGVHFLEPGILLKEA